MDRPICPHCKRPAVFVNSHSTDGLRVRGYGCKRCGEWSLGGDVQPDTLPRTRAVISKIARTASGRFAPAR